MMFPIHHAGSTSGIFDVTINKLSINHGLLYKNAILDISCLNRFHYDEI